MLCSMGLLLNGFLYMQVLNIKFDYGYSMNAIILIFCPIAGFLADVKFSRFRAIVTSSYVLLLSVIMVILAQSLALPNVYCFLIQNRTCSNDHLFWIGLGLSFLFGIFLIIGFVGFIANAIQFGLDQLHDSPAEDQSLFIHWFVWIFYVYIILSSNGIGLLLNLSQPFLKYIVITWIFVVPLLYVVLLVVALCSAHHQRKWFIIDVKRVNPYKLVLKVTKFAYQHKIPIRRSAFTYCEDDLPSGLDLGKNKYGGPFTAEEVEDVKAFYGILKVLLSYGTVFFFLIAVGNFAPPFDFVNTGYIYDTIWMTPMVILYLLPIVSIPLYLCLIRPFFSHCIPGMLKRMGIGILIILISLVLSTSLNTATYFVNGEKNASESLNISLSAPQVVDILLSANILQSVVASFSGVLILIALLEFICSQSPHSMKGLFIGLMLAQYGLFGFLSALFSKLKFHQPFFPTGGFLYLVLNTVLCLIFVIVYVKVAKNYKYRERDEPSNIRQYAEEYYSKDFGDSENIN